MATISDKDIARAIYHSYKEKRGEDFFRKVVEFLERRRFLSRQKRILESLEKIINEEEGVLAVKVSSLKGINEKDKKELVEFLKKRYGEKKIEFRESLDESILGGFRVEVRDEVIDLTLRNKIKKLQNHLIKSHA